jgi:hypothetical protein
VQFAPTPGASRGYRTLMKSDRVAEVNQEVVIMRRNSNESSRKRARLKKERPVMA